MRQCCTYHSVLPNHQVWEMPVLSNEHLAISAELETDNASTALYQNLGLEEMGLSVNATNMPWQVLKN